VCEGGEWKRWERRECGGRDRVVLLTMIFERDITDMGIAATI
jgi:hypothetical protein